MQQGQETAGGLTRTPTSYDRLSHAYDGLFDAFEAPLRSEAIRYLEARPGERILEIGSGTGRALPLLAAAVGRGGAVMGIDLSARMLSRASRRLVRRSDPACVLLVRACAPILPVRRVVFDAIFMTFTLELFKPPDDAMVLAECRRLLLPHGRLVVASLWMDIRPGFTTRAYELGHRLAPKVLDCRPIDVDGLLRGSGFEVRRSTTRSLAGIPVRLAHAVPADHSR